jgi:poly-gamma-glutamate capsule biosynthesis protein CapA/YwtB (metallophosphatase superfamily)
VNKIAGFELFLRKSVENVAVKFAEENASATDSAFVLKLVHNNSVEKYYINKRTYLIDKVVTLSNSRQPRMGGGFMESTISYEDYRNVNGVMIPFKSNMSNVVTIKIVAAEVKPLDESIFSQ